MRFHPANVQNTVDGCIDQSCAGADISGAHSGVGPRFDPGIALFAGYLFLRIYECCRFDERSRGCPPVFPSGSVFDFSQCFPALQHCSSVFFRLITHAQPLPLHFLFWAPAYREPVFVSNRLSSGLPVRLHKGPGKSKLDKHRPEIEALLANGSSQKLVAKRYNSSPANLANWMRMCRIKKWPLRYLCTVKVISAMVRTFNVHPSTIYRCLDEK